MASYLQIEKADRVATVRLNRPDKHNAFDEHLIAQLTQAFHELAKDAAARVVVLAANGPSFSAVRK
jgi:methylglutaconyl-CoA hydratase